MTRVAHPDTSDLASCGNVIDELSDRLGGLDVFVNNAGTGSATLALDMTVAEWRHVVATDLHGAFVCLQWAARRMVTAGHGGRLIAVTSVHEYQPRVRSAAYDAAKHGLGGLMKTLALELVQYAITANCVAPGEISTPMTGQEDQDPHQRPVPACREAVPVTPGRSPPSSHFSPLRRRPTSPVPAGPSTTGCCR